MPQITLIVIKLAVVNDTHWLPVSICSTLQGTAALGTRLILPG